MIAEACKGRKIVVWGENDKRLNAQGVEEWPGYKAYEVARQVSGIWGAEVSVQFPPPQFKDIRAWILGQVKGSK